MGTAKTVYKNPKPDVPVITSISTDCRTPILPVKFSNVITSYSYQNSSVPRYSITCVINPEKHKDFLEYVKAIEQREKVASILKIETAPQDGERVSTGNILMKFNSRDIIPVFILNGEGKCERIELEDEFAPGELVEVIFDIRRYIKKNTMQQEHGITFKPTSIIYYPQEEK